MFSHSPARYFHACAALAAIGSSSLCFSSLCSSTLCAQIPLGSALVLERDLPPSDIRRLWSLPLTPGATPVPVAPLPVSIARFANVARIDPVSGNVIVGTSTTGSGPEAELHVLGLNGTTVVRSGKLLSFPGTSGDVVDIYRERSGCFLVLCQDAVGAPRVFRVSVAPRRAMATPVPVTNVQFMSPLQGGIAADGAGNILLGLGAPVNLLYTLSPAGGSPINSASLFINTDAVEVATDGNVIAVGGGLGPGGPNYCCSANCTQLAPFGLFVAFVVDVRLTANGSQAVIGRNGGSVGAGTVSLINGTNCTPGIPVNIATFVGLMTIDPAVATKFYGCPCTTSNGDLPVLTEVTPPQINTNWTVRLDSSLPFRAANLRIGANNLSIGPTLIPVDIGAGCALLTSSELLVPTSTNAVGDVILAIPVPNNPALIGTVTFAQWDVADNIPNALGVTVTSAIRTVVL